METGRREKQIWEEKRDEKGDMQKEDGRKEKGDGRKQKRGGRKEKSTPCPPPLCVHCVLFTTAQKKHFLFTTSYKIYYVSSVMNI